MPQPPLENVPVPGETKAEATERTNVYDAQVAKAKARAEMWVMLQKVAENAGRVGAVVALILSGYATCSKADKDETNTRLDEQKEKILAQKEQIIETKQQTGKVLDYTTAVASSASAAVAAIAQVVPPSPVPTATVPPPAASGGCWVAQPSGVVRCTQPTRASSSALPEPPRMVAPAPPEIDRE